MSGLRQRWAALERDYRIAHPLSRGRRVANLVTGIGFTLILLAELAALAAMGAGR